MLCQNLPPLTGNFLIEHTKSATTGIQDADIQSSHSALPWRPCPGKPPFRLPTEARPLEALRTQNWICSSPPRSPVAVVDAGVAGGGSSDGLTQVRLTHHELIQKVLKFRLLVRRKSAVRMSPVNIKAEPIGDAKVSDRSAHKPGHRRSTTDLTARYNPCLPCIQRTGRAHCHQLMMILRQVRNIVAAKIGSLDSQTNYNRYYLYLPRCQQARYASNATMWRHRHPTPGQW